MRAFEGAQYFEWEFWPGWSDDEWQVIGDMPAMVEIMAARLDAMRRSAPKTPCAPRCRSSRSRTRHSRTPRTKAQYDRFSEDDRSR
jgi:hypothetical protein